MSTVEPLERF